MAMDEPLSTEAATRLGALERNDVTQDGQIRELFQRVNGVEIQQSAQGATLQAVQTDVSQTRQTTQQTNEKVDRLLMWMLGIAATTAVTAVLSLMQLVTKKP